MCTYALADVFNIGDDGDNFLAMFNNMHGSENKHDRSHTQILLCWCQLSAGCVQIMICDSEMTLTYFSLPYTTIVFARRAK